jgi:hypothetical protein
MRTAKMLLSSLALALLVWSPAQAQEPAKATVNVTGQWEFQLETQRGPMTTRISFKQDGEKLEGEATMRDQAVPFTGTVSGNTITFTISRTMGERTFEMTYTGTVEGNTATGTVTNPRGSTPWTAHKIEG